jgi:hypothetical protein
MEESQVHPPEQDPGNGAEPWPHRLAWLCGACIVFGLASFSTSQLIDRGIETPGYCWLVVAAVFAIPIVVAMRSWRRCEFKADSRNGGPPRKWMGVIWSAGAVTLFRSVERPETIDVSGLPIGPVELIVTGESGTRVEAVIRCRDHGGESGAAELELLPNNGIRLYLEFAHGESFDAEFRRAAKTASSRSRAIAT